MHPGDEDNPGYASPPCFMHELDPAFSAEQTDAQTAVDVARWRKAQRTRLLAERLASRPMSGRRPLKGSPAVWMRRSEPSRAASWASTGRSAASQTCANGLPA